MSHKVGDLYVEVNLEADDDGCYVPVYSAITLFVFKFCHVDHCLKLHLVTHSSTENCPVKLSHKLLNADLLNYQELPDMVQCGELPVCSEGKLIISGLCSVLRYIVRTAQQHVETFDLVRCLKSVLGVRENCLRACAEVSEWTMYTEVTLPHFVHSVLHNSDVTRSQLPAELLQLDNQLAKDAIEPSQTRGRARTAVVHRQDDTMQRNDKVNEDLSCASEQHSKSVNMMEKFSDVQIHDRMCRRPFVEGKTVQLTDLIIFVCTQLLFTSNTECWWPQLPRVVSWYLRMVKVPYISDAVTSAGLYDYHCMALSTAQCTLMQPSTVRNDAASVTSVDDESQSSSQSTSSHSLQAKTTTVDQSCIHHTEKTKFHACQPLVDTGIAKTVGLVREVLPVGNGRCLQLPWEQYPSWVVPCGVPEKRLSRKLQQLENIAAVVRQLVSTESRVIVDFCSGGGHVGILLAYLFPHCKLILVENKEESIRRAIERISCSTCDNITIVQCNLSRFHATFDIGICLHACGVASDLVLAKCIAVSASFVVSPCCYGAVHNTQSVNYPCSDVFQAADIGYREYLAIGHAADQTEVTIAKSDQGRLCMTIVDSDRCALAEQFGYRTQLFVMTPTTCSTKNHILTGFTST